MTLLESVRALRQASADDQDRLLLAAYSENRMELFTAIQLAADPFCDFGLTRVPEILEDDGALGSFSFADFHRLCVDLRSHACHGEAAKQAIRQAAEICHAETWNEVYRLILLHTPLADTAGFNRLIKRLGHSMRSYMIPRFAGQQAQAATKPINGRRLIDAKITGTRLFAIVEKGVHIRAADAIIREVPSVEHALQPLAAATPWPIVLDGVLTDQGIYFVFDLIPLAGFREGACDLVQSVRRGMLETLQRNGAFDAKIVRVLPQVEIDFPVAANDSLYAEFTDHLRDAGYTSIVIKNPDAPYRGKRNSAWVIQTF
jgi:hypothetical protein